MVAAVGAAAEGGFARHAVGEEGVGHREWGHFLRKRNKRSKLKRESRISSKSEGSKSIKTRIIMK